MNSRPGLKFLPDMPHTILQSRLFSRPKHGLMLASVYAVSDDFRDGFANDDQKLEKEKAEELDVGDGCVDCGREVRIECGLR